MPVTKIATCCYCSTRAALRLTGRDRHQLSCGTCGAPLSKMKMLPSAAPVSHAPVTTAPARAARPAVPVAKSAKRRKSRPKKRSKGIFGRLMGDVSLGRVWDEVKDEIEDIFD